MGNHNNQKKIKNIEIGKYYLIHDGSKSGHPGLIIWKDDQANLYLAIKIGSTSNKNNTLLNSNLTNDIINHYYYNKPFLGKHKDFGSKPFLDWTLTQELEKLSQKLINKAPIESKSIRRKDRYRFKRSINKK